jgi:bla regulator protein BlaR1
MDAIHTLTDTLLVRLAWTSAQATLLIGALWLLGRWMPRLSPAIRCMLWWVLSVQLIVGLVANTPVALPLLSAVPHSGFTTAANSHRVTPMATLAESTTPSKFVAASTPTSSAMTTTQMTTGTSMPARPFPWRSFVVTLWLVGLFAQLLLVARQWQKAHRVLRESTPLHDEALQAQCSQQARMLGLQHCPQLRVSDAIASPQVSGLWRPTVLLPANQILTLEESSMALAHELAHLRRGDLWLGWAPAIAQRLFFFHPLVAWAMREYALHREAACDAQVLQQHRAAPQDYGRLLLRLGVAHPMHSGLAGASPTFQNLKRRLIMLQQNTNAMSRTRGWVLVALVALAGVLPYRVTAGSTDQAQASPDTAVTEAPAAYPAPAPAALPAMPPLPGALPTPPAPSPPPLPPLPPMAPPAPPHPPVPPSFGVNGFSAHHIDIDTHANASDGFALFDGDTITINGSDTDLDAVKSLHQANKDPMLWFRHGNAAYIIRDKAFIEQARNIYAPQTELARQQGRLAGEQGRLAGQQAGLAARDAGFAQEQAALAQQQAQFSAQAAMQTTGDKQALDAQRRALDSERARLEQRHTALRSELDASRHELESQQHALEQQQHALEQRQQQASRMAEQAMNKLLNEALAKGLAQNVSRR